ncbi:MAG: NUDIX hydrolase, partial [Verrucomicrobiota bacterium]
EEEHRGEALEETARRELLEETGYHAAKVEPLIASPTSAGMTSEHTHLFLATDLDKREAGGGVGNEDIQVHRVPRSEIRDWLKSKEQEGTLIDFKIQAALWCAGI